MLECDTHRNLVKVFAFLTPDAASAQVEGGQSYAGD